MTAEEIRRQDAELGIDATWYRNGESPYMHLTGPADVLHSSLQNDTEEYADDIGNEDDTEAHANHRHQNEVDAQNLPHDGSDASHRHWGNLRQHDELSNRCSEVQ